MIYTARYPNRNITNKKHVPVAISRGLPRYRLRYQIELRLLYLAPSRDLLRGDYYKSEFERLYCVQLKKTISVDFVADQLHQMQYDGRDVVLLCFEDIRIRGNWCHRRMFAKWWKKQTKKDIKELDED